MYQTKAILTIQHVKLVTTLSRTQIYAMERAGMFPKRLPVSHTRGVWCHQDICAWMQGRIDARRGAGKKPAIVIHAGDRFISKQELIGLVTITEPTFLPAERAGQFPARVQLSRGRVAWLRREVIEWLNTRPRSVDSIATGAARWQSA